MREVNSLAKELKASLGWHQARVTLLAQFIFALIKVRTVNLVQVAQAFSGDTSADSNYKRLQRFLRHFEIDFDVVAIVISHLFCPEGKWVLSLDRTNWQLGKYKINFLVLGVVVQNVAIPIFWTTLPKKGNSNTDDRLTLMNRFLGVFGSEKIECLTADREFKGAKWLAYLKEEKINFCIRIANNTKVWNKHRNRKLPVSRIFSLQLGEQMSIRKARSIWGVPVYLSCIRGARGLVVIASSESPEKAIETYRQRWAIETLFGCLKTRGFNLEATHVTDLERLKKLFLVLTITFAWCLKVGIWITERKPIVIKKHGRQSKSIFRIGLDQLRRPMLSNQAALGLLWRYIRFLSCT